MEHNHISSSQLLERLEVAVNEASPEYNGQGVVLFKVEPLVLHILARDVVAAQNLLSVAFTCGFRESGLAAGRKTMVAIRTTANSIELPIVSNGKLLVGEEYLRFLVTYANEKFDANAVRTRVLHDNLISYLQHERGGGEEAGLLDTRSVGMTMSETSRSWSWREEQLNNSVVESIRTQRWGHSSTSWKDYIVVFGGYGHVSSDKNKSRLNDVLLISWIAQEHGKWKPTSHLSCK